jgi:hypothetical protein
LEPARDLINAPLVLERTQAAGIAIFWEHDLRPLAAFVLAAR